jgi:ubiquinol-cytochrome c reductase cytochrome b subunit
MFALAAVEGFAGYSLPDDLLSGTGVRITEGIMLSIPVVGSYIGSLFFFTFGVLAVLATFAQVNPIWLYGPYHPDLVSSLSQPDWYFGFLEGALRMMPGVETSGVETSLGGYTFVWNVFLPAVVVPLRISSLSWDMPGRFTWWIRVLG